jgi:polysaccharide pyruvyl transferase WcaK-like protein
VSVALVPCNTRCLNMGDVAMLQVAVSRLRTMWPDEELRIFTSDAAALARYCPGVTAVMLPDQPGWCTDRYLGGRLHSWLPERLSDRLADAVVRTGCRAPSVREHLLRLRSTVRRPDRRSLRAFIDTIASARLLVVGGAGGVADHFGDYANLVLLALQCARRRGIPTAIMSHGFGPLTTPHLRAKAAAVLPKVDTIALREARASRPLLISLGVGLDRVVTTGDDAIELAYEARPAVLGRAVGINLRLARAAGATERDIEPVRDGLRRFLSGCPAPLAGLPIARQRELDVHAIKLMFAGLNGQANGHADVSHADGSQADGGGADDGAADDADAGQDLDTPLKVIRRTGRCRIVVTGAYHAAVFALAQGVPAVCLARTQYFHEKFLGLADQFGAGCHLVSLDDEDLPGELARTMTLAWNEAPVVRETLLRAAACQITQGYAAYQRLPALVRTASRA